MLLFFYKNNPIANHEIINVLDLNWCFVKIIKWEIKNVCMTTGNSYFLLFYATNSYNYILIGC